MVQQSIPATTSTLFKDNSHRKQYKRNPHLLAGIVVAAILFGNAPSKLTAAVNATGKITTWCKTTHKRPQNKNRRKTQTISLVATFLPNSNSNRKYVSVELNNNPVWLQTDTASDITCIFKKLWKCIGKPQLTSTKYVGQSASEDCVHITGELPTTIRIEKTASGTIYISNSQHNLLGLDFIEPLGLLDTPPNFVCNAV